MQILFKLFLVFFKIGAFTFGGGYAMVAIIHAEVVEKNKWLSDDEMMNLLVIAEATPGVLAVNTATFTGYKIAGVFGAALATLGVTLPSLIIISIIATFFDAFRKLKYISYAFAGIRAGVILLILEAVLKFNKKNKKNRFYYIIVLVSLFLAAFFNISAIYILIGAALFGILNAKINGNNNLNNKNN